MLEVHVVTSANRHIFADRLDEYYHWRYKIYVQDKRWCAENAGEREIDQFDHDDAFYLLGYRAGRFVAGTRLMPSSGPTLLRDVFPRLAEARGVPDQAEWADWTRMFTVPSARGNGHSGVTGAMCCAVMEYCVSEGIRWVGGVQEAYWLPRWADFGWDVKVLGLPEVIKGASTLAAFMEVSKQGLETVRAVTGVSRPQIVHVGPKRPFLPIHVPSPGLAEDLKVTHVR